MVAGGLIGAGGGLLAGLAGSAARGPLGWGIAGTLGGCGPAFLLMAIIGAELDRYAVSPFLVILVAAAAVSGTAPGVAIGSGLREKRSRLPGVSQLATVIQEADSRDRPARTAGQPAELAPAAIPDGRGDEPAPTA
jgi:hypothetical protein